MTKEQIPKRIQYIPKTHNYQKPSERKKEKEEKTDMHTYNYGKTIRQIKQLKRVQFKRRT